MKVNNVTMVITIQMMVVQKLVSLKKDMSAMILENYVFVRKIIDLLKELLNVLMIVHQVLSQMVQIFAYYAVMELQMKLMEKHAMIVTKYPVMVAPISVKSKTGLTVHQVLVYVQPTITLMEIYVGNVMQLVQDVQVQIVPIVLNVQMVIKKLSQMNNRTLVFMTVLVNVLMVIVILVLCVLFVVMGR